MKHTIQWVGDEPRNYKGTNSFAVAGKSEDGTEFKKTKVEIPESAPQPQKGDVIDGSLTPHPRLDGAFLLQSGGSAANTSNGAAPAVSTDERGDKIDRAVAFKGAVELVAAGVNGVLSDDAYVESVGSLTAALLPVVKGGSPADPPTQPDPQEQPSSEGLSNGEEAPF